MKQKKSVAILFFLPFAVCFFLFWLAPFLYGVYMSLCKFSLTKGNRGFIGLENYAKIFSSDSMYYESFFRGLKQTLIFVAGSVPFLVLVALILALVVEALPRAVKGFYRTVYFMSYAISVTAVSAIFKWLFDGNGGYINAVLLGTGLISSQIQWLETQPYAWISLILATVWWTVGYNMILFINALNSIDTDIYEAADVDGAGYFQKLFRITLPNIRAVTGYVLLTSIIASFNMYGQSALITRSGPRNTTSTLIAEINATIFNNNNLGVGTAMALLMGIVVMVIAMLQRKIQRADQMGPEVIG